MKLTREERNAITALKGIARQWPESLWLFSSDGKLMVMKNNHNNEAAMIGLSYDPDYKIAEIDIPHDFAE